MRDGTLWLQRTYPGVGRIMKRSGTHNRAIRNRFHATLDALYERGRLDILERIRDNQLTMKEVHDKFSTGKLDAVSVSDLGTLKTVANGVIQSPMLVWVKKADLSENTRIDYQKRFNVFLKTVGATFEMSQLPRLLGQFKDKYQSKKRSFNAVRTAVMAWLNATVGTDDIIYKKVKAIRPYTYVPDKSRINPLCVKDVLTLCSRLRALDARWNYPATHSRHQAGERAAQMLWSLCLLGANWKEYSRDGWQVEKKQKRILIFGKKRVQRDRYIPLVDAQLVKPLLPLDDFRTYLNTASKGTVMVKDTRNTFIKWCYGAGIPHLRVEFYAGHQSPSMSIYYATASGPSKTELEQDAVALKSFLETERLTVQTPSFIVKGGTPHVNQ